ncbi:MAG TPA: pyridoxamine 5'-phosphate oxidase family protein [Acidimicrobiia bacterium]|nr:pyridoxamine 5'-phosphate oxidase family protein [Acidimicrobiia bacterium]
MQFVDLTPTAQKIISGIFYMTIASVNEDHSPWISPVYFNYDDECNLYWISFKDAIHSRNVTMNKKASISIFDSTAPNWKGDGVYLQCDVEVLEADVDIAQGIKSYYGGRHVPHALDHKEISDYQTNKPWRIYKAAPYDIATLGEGSEVDGYPIDQRIPAHKKS